MLARLARLIYWSCAAVALVFVGLGVAAASSGFTVPAGETAPAYVAAYALFAVVAWLPGRAVLYLLAGE